MGEGPQRWKGGARGGGYFCGHVDVAVAVVVGLEQEAASEPEVDQLEPPVRDVIRGQPRLQHQIPGKKDTLKLRQVSCTHPSPDSTVALY